MSYAGVDYDDSYYLAREREETARLRQRVAQLEAKVLALTPKPSEPTGLGAVVKDREGHVWCRIHESYGDLLWRMEVPNTAPVKYADIDAVEVLSEGVTP